jgi:predicted ATP-dependent protease
VIIPTTNTPHLMLRADVVAAVAAGHFSIWAVRTVDEALELLTGLPAGERGAAGTYPAASVNGRVEAGLDALVERELSFAVRAQAAKAAVRTTPKPRARGGKG